MLSFDPSHLGPEFYSDPYPTYRALREQDPLHLCPDGSWFLTRYADVDRIYRDRRSFSSDKKAAFAPKFGEHSPLYEHHTSSLVFNDPPYHTRVRRAIVGALSPRVLKDMEPGLISLIDRLIEQVEARREFDAIEDFAAAIPVEVIGNLLSVPQAERGSLRAWSLAILGALEPVLTPEQQQRGNAAVTDFLAYLRTLIRERRRSLVDDDPSMLARLIREERAAEPITETELLHNCVFLLNAGHETTTNLIGNALHLLLTHEDQLRKLRAEPVLITTTVEEVLRFQSPNQLGNRLVVEDVRVADKLLQPGTYLHLCIGAANRDPDVFPEPDQFEIGRVPNQHLAFAAGSHACAGMSVARLEAQLAIQRIIRQFPRLRLEGEGVRGARARFRGFGSLPLATH